MTLSIGQTLHNRYRIDSFLGQGGMGAVYRAWDVNLDISVAIKENLDTSHEAQKQFGREARILARLSHPNLPRVTNHFFIPSQGQYLVMDFVEGEDLEAMLNRLGVLPEPQVLVWTAQICDALVYLHSQPSPIIHRDIKPANIKIRPDGKAVLVDFGIAKVYDPHLATTIGAKAVTPGYSPPEQYGGGRTDARSDIYALGATMYHLLTGQTPPESVQRMVEQMATPKPSQLNQQVSPMVEQVILKAIEVTTDRRFQSVDELRAVLTKPLSGTSDWSVPTSQLPILQQKTAMLSSRDKPSPRFSRFAILGGVGIAIIVLIAGVALTLSGVFSDTRPAATTPDIIKPPYGNGRIAFVSDRDGNEEIYAVDADGRNLTRLTNNSAQDLSPAWSPDGKLVAFSSDRDGNFEIYTTNADGTNLTRLTTNSAEDLDPAWSPDGKLVAFSSDSGDDNPSEIYTINVDGTSLTRVTRNWFDDTSPVWSPDGKHIAFTSARHLKNNEIYVMQADGTDATPLTSYTVNNRNPAWFPNGKRITFDSDRDDNFEIYTMGADGTNPTRLTANWYKDISPVWSPNGEYIAFSSNRDGNFEVYIMSVDGTNVTCLTDNAANDQSPAWSPQ